MSVCFHPRLTVSGTCLSCITAAWCLSLLAAPGSCRPGCRLPVLPARAVSLSLSASLGGGSMGSCLYLQIWGWGAGDGLALSCLLGCEMSTRSQVCSYYGIFLQNLLARNLDLLYFFLLPHPVSRSFPNSIRFALPVCHCLRSSLLPQLIFKPCYLSPGWASASRQYSPPPFTWSYSWTSCPLAFPTLALDPQWLPSNRMRGNWQAAG